MILLLLAAALSDPATLMSRAQARLAVPCRGPGCAAPVRRSAYRIDEDPGPALTAKDRAIGDDGSRCNVVGARRCTSHAKTLFRTDLAR